MFVKNLLTLTCVAIGYFSFSCHCQDFGYDGNVGPTHWGQKYEHCVGKHQSPVDIEEVNVKVVKFPPLKFENFEESLDEVKLVNNGHTVVLAIIKGKKPEVYGGPLKANYVFSQLHFHWGVNDTEGSENIINNHSFPMELHMVFYRKNYDSVKNAGNHTDGLTVLSLLYQATHKENDNYKVLEEELSKVHNLNSSTVIKKFTPLSKLAIKKRDIYYTYKGSLTTPPCSEVVTWIEFKDTIPLSHEQLQGFRLLYGKTGHLTHNFRPPQPLYDRVIFMNSISNCLKIDQRLLIVIVLVSVIYSLSINQNILPMIF